MGGGGGDFRFGGPGSTEAPRVAKWNGAQVGPRLASQTGNANKTENRENPIKDLDLSWMGTFFSHISPCDKIN